MADRWVSNKKYFCEYCRIFIADNKPSRTQHETGLKHKGNIEKHLTEVRKRDAEKRKQDEINKRIVDQVERKATGIYAKEAGTAYSLYSKVLDKKKTATAGAISERPSSSTPSITSAYQQPTVINPNSGLGEWSVVEDPKPAPCLSNDEDSGQSTSNTSNTNTSTESIPSKYAKLDHEAVYEEDVDGEGVSEYKIAEKRAATDNIDESVTFKKKKKNKNLAK
ncbi:UNVERIFIED_CONTAM: hypothetical protein HDU68_005896 [Siphonaria sp. JEL0065]|nr:hypothetical protein HDU68_005896 [Siphonaria sp. JEL0065]